MWFQKEISLKSRNRGFHVITHEIESQIPELRKIKVGLANIFIKHTSASLTLNENVSPDVLRDMEAHFNKMVPENMPYYQHIYEGADDMPAHLKNVCIGSSISIPITFSGKSSVSLETLSHLRTVSGPTPKTSDILRRLNLAFRNDTAICCLSFLLHCLL